MRCTVAGVIFAVCAGPAPAASAADVERLHDALRTDELLEILRDEGIGQSRDLLEELAPGQRYSGWLPLVSAIYDLPAMSAEFRAAFADEIGASDVTPLVDFFESEPGRKIVELELDARRAISDPDVEAAARAAVRRADDAGGVRDGLLRDFIEVNDLVENNVVGTLNANLAFLLGLESGTDRSPGDRDPVATAWDREDEIRADSEDWLMAYLSMAYRPLTDDEFRPYVELSATGPGRILNRALFAGYDAVFKNVSHEMGRAIANLLKSEDL